MATQCVGSMRTSKGQSNTFLQGEKKKSWRASRAARPQAADLLPPRGGRGGEDGRRDSVGFYRVGL